MCGIFGTILFNDFNYQNRNIVLAQINDLALYNMTRGTHSTGIARIDALSDNEGKHFLYKNVGPASEVSEHKEWLSVCSINKDTTVIVGHTRYATHGAINVQNAHPFFVASLVGVHNGVVRNALMLHSNFEVDSEAALFHIGTNGESAIEDLTGSAALAYVKLNDPRKLHLYRDSNPIYVYINYKDKYLLFSSQESHIVATAAPQGFNDYEIIFELPARRIINVSKDGHMFIDNNNTTMWGGGQKTYSGIAMGYGYDHDETWNCRTSHILPAVLPPKTTLVTTQQSTPTSNEIETFVDKDNNFKNEFNISVSELMYICGQDTEHDLLQVANNFFNPEVVKIPIDKDRSCDICGEISFIPSQEYNYIPNICIHVCEKCLATIQNLLVDPYCSTDEIETNTDSENIFNELYDDNASSWQDDMLTSDEQTISKNWIEVTEKLGYSASDLFCKYCEKYLGDEPLGTYSAKRNRFNVPICDNCATKISSMEKSLPCQ